MCEFCHLEEQNNHIHFLNTEPVYTHFFLKSSPDGIYSCSIDLFCCCTSARVQIPHRTHYIQCGVTFPSADNVERSGLFILKCSIKPWVSASPCLGFLNHSDIFFNFLLHLNDGAFSSTSVSVTQCDDLLSHISPRKKK